MVNRMNRRVLRGGATFLLALATGHLMQNGTAVAGLFGVGGKAEAVSQTAMTPSRTAQAPIVEATVTELSADTSPAAVDASLPAIPEFPLADARPLGSGAALAARMIQVERGYSRVKSAADAEYNSFGLTCADARLTLEPLPYGLLDMRLDAPCHPGERVVVSLGGLDVTYSTDAKGQLAVTVPALDRTVQIAAVFAAGDRAESALSVPEADGMQRLAVGWTGISGFGLNAYEGGARFGSAGHVRADAAGAPGAADRGYLMLLGDAGVAGPMLAQVYTAPAHGPEVRLEVEAAVTAATCGNTLAGRAVTLTGGARQVTDVTMAMPGCDAKGDLVVMDVTSALNGPVEQASN